MSIIRAIDTQFNRMKERGWNKIFYFFDIHETILYPDYNNLDEPKFYKHAKEVLQHLSKRDDISINIYTCSYPEEIERYIKFFKKHDIDFDFINRNPEAKNTTYGYYEDKPYFNVLFEDKAGFDAENDWVIIKNYFNIKNYEGIQTTI